MAARKAVAKELSREQIVKVARELFATQGYRAVSMRSIAQKLGYSHGSLYYHFKEKAELFNAIVQEDYRTLQEQMKKSINQTDTERQPQHKLESLMETFIHFGLSNPHHYEMMFCSNEPETQQYARPEQGSCYETFASLVREAAGDTLQKIGSMYTIPWVIFLSLHGFVVHYIQTKQTYEDVEALVKVHVRYLASQLIGDREA
ncbi:TetR/AcrR family transcriptional regulator [Brevibacillus laterosporus]|uniref:TetR/AcrR family transcriptional regulator n=1 Tax=Brevibacillus laterosporus TaxID=1465 RepID=A0AAP3DBT0_BRELA|nr:TetR/AcrR family transcriptional regulator [Brevibacillus laterosporus]MCR8978217.1 TetR/AcrR family transcriptional regulator [Brevibacillus laterosporus]MCZ0805373.1 TetR/AcrR family transcriptional regulator [Brevibacillus laterosporus]MCZ0824059.1 TetR/AcrR family transcriptional regulator [Brevibacillus laterosporus]MCZ0848961.1 TetR/AcrR family transcriptional regulator [Brevibacillus laterosporus]